MDPEIPPVTSGAEAAPRSARLYSASGGDRLAVVLGNATLLGLGYLFLRRWVLAGCAVVGTAVVLVGLALAPGEPGWLVALGLWWAAMVVHAWFLTRAAAGAPAGPVLWQRVVAGAVVVLLVGTGAAVRADAQRVVQDAGRSHAAGDCTAASATLGRLNAAHSIVAASTVLDGRADLAACGVLLDALAQQDPVTAAERLQAYLDDPAAAWDGAGPERAARLLEAGRLKAGFAQLRTTLDDAPDQSDATRKVLETFLASLDGRPPCKAVETDTWVHGRTWEEPELAEPVAAAADEVPERVLACARAQAKADQLKRASATYGQFLDRFGDHREARTARSERYDVDTAIQRADALRVLQGSSYCGNPVPYRGAPAYSGPGPHRGWWFGVPDYRTFPSGWQTDDIDKAQLVVCLHDAGRGAYLDTCQYTADDGTVLTATFHAWRFRITAYSLRTGKVVERYSTEIGDPCPEYYFFDAGDTNPVVTSGAQDESFWAMFDRFQ